MDSAIENRASPTLTKVETFNNFSLLFCTTPNAHVQECLRLALRILHVIEHVTRPDGNPTQLKIGLSSGPFTTALIGLQSPRYSLFGDTVNTASRMASSATPCCASSPFIHISPSARSALGAEDERELLDELAGGRELVLDKQCTTQIKGKGLMQTSSLHCIL
mmetsp:Transcript_5634/g.10749  ORF Transcript_5634/g.10749 Transcript_5634/m.10749 type:complete len:163 (+) Transcript_5634:2-490(+)